MSRRFDAADNEFIRLRGGEEYVRKFEVNGLRWKPYITDEGEKCWSLLVFFNDAPHSIFYGEDAKAIMKAFDLPVDPPEKSDG